MHWHTYLTYSPCRCGLLLLLLVVSAAFAGDGGPCGGAATVAHGAGGNWLGCSMSPYEELAKSY